ncbi:hypothetical protein Sjap_025456 [Stephania japonica]|uniref:Uncharacterized protein n=1 Tax=Stephania japonica TaxID=461633 RepID=A0AAP0E1M8_9MAGN
MNERGISSEGSQPRVKLLDASNGMDGRKDMEMDVENNTYKESLVSVKKIRFMENLRLQEGDMMIREDDLGPIVIVSQRNCFQITKGNKKSIGGNKGKSVKGKANNGEVNLKHQQCGKNSTQLLSEVANQAQFKSNAINGPLKVPIGSSLDYSPEATNISIEALEVGEKLFQTGKGPRAKGVFNGGTSNEGIEASNGESREMDVFVDVSNQ